MIDLVLRANTDLVYGRGTEARVGELITEFGGSTVLIHHSGEPFVLPLIKKVKGYLRKAGLAYVELGGVVPNPHIELVYEGINLCRKEKVDFILAVGGGSVIDSAKAIGLGVEYEGDVWDLYEQKAKPKACLPLGVISTFAGTGSEATFGTVITKGKNKRGIEDTDDHVIIRPKFAIMNPEITFTIPKFQSAVGIADLFSHLVENFFTKDPDNDFSDELIVACLQTVIKFAPIVLREPKNYEARGTMMILAPLAINGVTKIGRWGDWGCHAIEHEVSGEWNIPHGSGLAILMPTWMRYIYHENMDLFLKFAINVFNVPINLENPEQTVVEGIDRFSDFLFKVLELPSSFRKLGIPVDQLTNEILWRVANQAFFPGNPTIGRTFPLYPEDVFSILKLCV